MTQTNVQNRKRLPDLENELMVARGRMGRRVRWRVWDRHVHIAVFKMNNQQGLTVQLMELCSVLCGSLDGREVLGENGYILPSMFT